MGGTAGRLHQKAEARRLLPGTRRVNRLNFCDSDPKSPLPQPGGWGDGAGSPPLRPRDSMSESDASRAVHESGPARDVDARWAFQLRLGDELRLLSTARDVQATACRLLGDYLRAERVCYVDIDGDDFDVQAC